MSFNFAPKGWAMCNGQFMPINQNQALFALLGTTFGGNGQTTFALPDFRNKVPIHVGSGHTLGEQGGEQAHTLSQAEMPMHIHVLNASTSRPRRCSRPQSHRGLPRRSTRPPQPDPMSPTSVTTVGAGARRISTCSPS